MRIRGRRWSGGCWAASLLVMSACSSGYNISIYVEMLLAFRGRFKLNTSLSLYRVSKSTYSAPSSSSGLSLCRLWYRMCIPKTRAFAATLRPMPPIPRMPRTLPCGSWPSAGRGEPRHLPSRRALMPMGRLRRAPMSSQMVTSAVASSTAVGVLETRTLWAVQAVISIWS